MKSRRLMKDRKENPSHKVGGGVLLFLCILFVSCTGDTVYHEYQAINNISWDKDKEYYFTFPIDDISIPYTISFEVRNNNLYPYQNLWLFFSEEHPAGAIARDTIEYVLADEYGKWKGNGIFLHHSSFSLKTNYVFPYEGQYTFSFRQGMRDKTLRGIQNIGLRIEKVN